MRITLSAIIVLLISLTSCSGSSKRSDDTATTNALTDHIEVLYFHGKQRCITCNAIEKLTTEVLRESFSDEVANGKILFRVIDISQKENQSIVDKYEVSWSSLYINKWNDGMENCENMTDFGFSYAKSSPAVFKKVIKEKIGTLLN